MSAAGDLILAIETSCDETAAAVIERGSVIRANVVASQVDLHRRFGGVVPEIASRRHLELSIPVVKEALERAGGAPADLAAVAVTSGPGLVGALLVGVSLAKSLAFGWGKPLVGVNHLEGHIYANFLTVDEDGRPVGDGRPPEFPFLCLVVSGGHSDLIYITGHGERRALGRTRDDAAGEAFDKVARAIGLGYPGGPLLDALAREGGDPHAIELPRAYLEPGSFDFSFSGLKTAVVHHLERAALAGQEVNRADLAASFSQAVADVLVDKTVAAARATGANRVILAGGVAANSSLRLTMRERAGREGLTVHFPPLKLCTDNAAMIGSAGYFRYMAGGRSGLELNADPNLALGS
ncbi:MAG: tRNA (adenosine(37)-N6)-threonylcarbamoyltransferase complex transferase subunit TsaD [Bacillota bacterium]